MLIATTDIAGTLSIQIRYVAQYKTVQYSGETRESPQIQIGYSASPANQLIEF